MLESSVVYYYKFLLCTTGSTRGTGTAYPFGASELASRFLVGFLLLKL